MMPKKQRWTQSAIDATQERRKTKLAELGSTECPKTEDKENYLKPVIIRPESRQVAKKAIQTSVGESKHICRTAHEQNGAFLLDFLEREGRLPEGASLEHSGDMECVIRWKKDEWKFGIR